jgi:plastin-1
MLFSALSTDTPGRVDKSSVLQALKASGESYDRARETLKHVSVDASGKVELEDWVEVCYDDHDVIAGVTQYLACAYKLNVKLRNEAKQSVLPTRAGKVTVQGSNANVSHTINEDERSEFTNHINVVCLSS